MFGFQSWDVKLVYIAAIIMAAFFFVRCYLARRQIASEIDPEWDALGKRNAREDNLSKAGFAQVYMRWNAPRFGYYAAGALVAAMILTPVWLALYDFLWVTIWRLGGESEMYRRFGLFWYVWLMVSTVFLWALSFYILLKDFHKKAPHSWREEVIKAREDHPLDHSTEI